MSSTKLRWNSDNEDVTVANIFSYERAGDSVKAEMVSHGFLFPLRVYSPKEMQAIRLSYGSKIRWAMLKDYDEEMLMDLEPSGISYLVSQIVRLDALAKDYLYADDFDKGKILANYELSAFEVFDNLIDKCDRSIDAITIMFLEPSQKTLMNLEQEHVDVHNRIVGDIMSDLSIGVDATGISINLQKGV